MSTWISAREAKRIMRAQGYAEDTLYTWHHLGQITCKRHGRYLEVDLESLRARLGQGRESKGASEDARELSVPEWMTGLDNDALKVAYAWAEAKGQSVESIICSMANEWYRERVRSLLQSIMEKGFTSPS